MRQVAVELMFVVGTRNSWEHDDEIMQLYEQMEKHISCEKERIEQKVSVFLCSSYYQTFSNLATWHFRNRKSFKIPRRFHSD